MVWIHMYAHEYICFFTKYEYFMYFLVSRFFTRFFAGSDPVHILGFAGSMTGPVLITLGCRGPIVKIILVWAFLVLFCKRKDGPNSNWYLCTQ